MGLNSTHALPRSAWIEVDLTALRHNFVSIRAHLPVLTELLYVVKDDAYGLGAVAAARVALSSGASRLAVFTLEEALTLRNAGITAPILLFGERLEEELPWVLSLDLEPCLGRLEIARAFNELARSQGRLISVHLKINTGMNRFGFSWRTVTEWGPQLAAFSELDFAGAMTHFAQSDELDKTVARMQIHRFQSCINQLCQNGLTPRCLHQCNSGGVLDLPEAYLDIVRVGLLAHGVYPSLVCGRLPDLRPVMTVKARVVAIQTLVSGDTVGYGMRWRAERPSRIGVLPLGYGDGFPRIRNEGHALIQGTRAPLVGGVTMDALMIDLTDLPSAEAGEEAVLMGRQGAEEITAQDLSLLKQTVTYDLLTGWRRRLPRVYLGS